jgi:cytidine deaminase
LSICAERAAMHRAVAQGHRRLAAIAVVADPAAMPCGACRQVMQEFGVGTVIVAGETGGPRAFRLAELLSRPFGPGDMLAPSDHRR